MRIAVLPNSAPLPAGRFDARFSLFEAPDPRSTGSVGTGVAAEYLSQMHRSAPTAAWDLTALTMAAIAADRHVNRFATSPDGWTRRIELVVAVNDQALWVANRSLVEGMLGFLTGDIWGVEFVGGGFTGLEPRRVCPQCPEDCVALLSGGLDSLIGAINMHELGAKPLYVSNRVRGDCEAQRDFAEATASGGRLLALNHNARTRNPAPEISQRPRSLAFIAFGVLGASALDKHHDGETVDLHVPENGFISLNVPLTPLRSGSLSTRTTHPIFIAQMQQLIDNLGLRVRLINPYCFMTKGEMMLACKDQTLLARLAPKSMSCGKSGRIRRHCGRCLPCLVRRGAFLKWSGRGDGDVTNPRYAYPSIDFRETCFREHDDVVQCLAAMDTVSETGVRMWVGPSVTAGRFQNPEKYRAVAGRGLEEIVSFLRAVGLP